ncbi:unnamed protein product, partial [Mesorhabditis spiculigera]
MGRKHTSLVLLVPGVITIAHVILFVWKCDCIVYKIPEYIWDSDLTMDSPKMIYYLYAEVIKIFCLALLIATDIALLVKLYRHGLYKGLKYTRSQATTEQPLTFNEQSASTSGTMENSRRRRKLRIDARLALGFTYLCVTFVSSSVRYVLKDDMNPVLSRLFYHMVGILDLTKCPMYILIVTKR